MKLESKNKVIDIILRTKYIVDIRNTLKEKDFETGYFTAFAQNDVDALSKIIYTLAEDGNGKKAFKNSSEVFDFLDEIREENKEMTIAKVFDLITKEVNEQGFFKKKMEDKEIEEMKSQPFTQSDINNLMKNATQKVVDKMATQKFQSED